MVVCLNGKNHIVTGFASLLLFDGSLNIVDYVFKTDIRNTVFEFVFRKPDFLNDLSGLGGIITSGVSYLFCFILFLFGVLFPDSDQENSMMGKHFYIPVRHRTWTHTIWFILPSAVAAVFLPYFVWIAYGCFIHILIDSWSRGGVCWFYPISQYKTYASGAQIKKKHWAYLYHTGKTSEKVVVFLFSFIAGVLFTLGLLLKLHVLVV